MLPEEGWVVFPTRDAARRAASEIAGDLGSSPSAIRLRDYEATDAKWWYGDSDQVIGRQRLDSNTGQSLNGWRDDYHGHTFLDGQTIQPHVNAWVDDMEFHLFYQRGGVTFDANGLPVPRGGN